MALRKILIGIGLVLFLTAASHAPPPSPGNFLGIDGLTIGGAGSVTTSVLIVIYMLREWRETRKLSSEDRLARREGYARQVESLQVENRKLRDDLLKNEEIHSAYRHACQHETDQLRQEIRELEDNVNGLRRRLDTHTSVTVRVQEDRP